MRHVFNVSYPASLCFPLLLLATLLDRVFRRLRLAFWFRGISSTNEGDGVVGDHVKTGNKNKGNQRRENDTEPQGDGHGDHEPGLA